MMRLPILILAAITYSSAFAKTILVHDATGLTAANHSAGPGDTLLLQNGNWNNVVIQLTCSGSRGKPIVVKAQTPGKLVISGTSQLRLGGDWLIVDGLCFVNGHAPSGAVIDFHVNKRELANNCRVTNCVINDFNQPRRMTGDSWVVLFGKNNRVDHCSFLNKKNMGVLLAVLLDDERSRENFHSIDHNYFGLRLPLASNGGEIIRVGLSQHCQFYSNTKISDNFFEHCDGEAEVISIKSCGNMVTGNVFKECQGSVVLRHGNYNTVTNNLFLGNGKEQTGGVRIINKGQWVINNLFYRLRGESFRAPLVLMNGIPNSPANRYVQVTDAVVLNNSFVDCAPMSLGEGSDSERTLAPANVLFASNIFYNNYDSVLYRAWSSISGIRFVENRISNVYKQHPEEGFAKTKFSTEHVSDISVPFAGGVENLLLDSLRQIGQERLPKHDGSAGFSDLRLIKRLKERAAGSCGAKWFRPGFTSSKPMVVNCRTASDIYNCLSKYNGAVILKLTGTEYIFDRPVMITGRIRFTAIPERTISFLSEGQLSSVFLLKGKTTLEIENVNVSASRLHAGALISSDTSGSCEHYNLAIKNCSFTHLNFCGNIFFGRKSTLADSIVVLGCTFSETRNGFVLADEKDNKGYYNVGKLRIGNNNFLGGKGVLIDLYRGGSDESTLGPNLIFEGNIVSGYSQDGEPIMRMVGVQKTSIQENVFRDCNPFATLILYKDLSRAKHSLYRNQFIHSGVREKNKFVSDNNNSVL